MKATQVDAAAITLAKLDDNVEGRYF